MSVNLGTAEGHLDLDITRFQAALQTAYASSQKQFKNMETAVGATLTSAGTKMASVGKSMTKYLTTPIVGAAAAAVKYTADFDESMSKVQALSGATGDELQQLRDKAREMGAKTKFSASESAEAFQYMALAGWKTGDMLNGIEGIMNLAAASGENLATVSDIVTDGLTAFGLEAKDSAHFADVLAAAMANSNTDVAGLGEAFKYVGPVAGAFGYSIEDVSIALGSMANAGIKGSSMGTALRQALVQLTGPTEEAQMYMDRYGISLYDGEGRTKSLMTVMQDLRGAFGDVAQDMNLSQEEMERLNAAVQADEGAWYDYAKGLNIPATAQEKLTALTEIFGARAMPAMLAIIQSGEGDFNKLTEAIYGASDAYDGAGTAAGMAETMLDNLNGQITIIKSAIGELAISIGDALMPTIRKVAERVQELVDRFNSLSAEEKMHVIQIAGLVASIGPLIFAFGRVTTGAGKFLTAIGNAPKMMAAFKGGVTTLVTGVKNVGEAFTLARAGFTGFASQTSVLGTALAGITAPMVAVVAVVGTLVAAFVHLWRTNEGFRDGMISIWEQIKSTFDGFCQGVVDRLNALGFSFSDITEAIGATWDAFCNLLAPVFTTAFQQIQVILETVLGVLTGILDVFIGLFTGNWEQLWSGLKGIVGSVFGGIKATVENILNNGVLGILRVFSGNAEMTWSDVWNALKSTVSNVGNAIVNGVKSFINNVVNFFSQLPGKIAGFLSSVISNVGKWVTQMASNARNAGQQFLQNVSSFVQQLPYKIGQFLGTVIGTVAKWVMQFAQNARQAGQQFLTNVVNFVQQLPGRIATFLSNVISNVTKWAADMAKNALRAGQQFLQNVVNFFQQLPGNVANFLSNVINNVAQWAARIPQQASEAASSFLSNVSNFLAQLPGTVANFLSQVISTLAGWVGQMGVKGAEAISSLINAVVSGAAGIPGQMAAIGQNIVQGVWNGIQGAIGWFTSQVNSFFSGIVDGAKSALGIASPSKVFKKEVGENIVKGIQAGISSESKSLQKEIDKLNDTIVKKSELRHRKEMRLEEAAGKKLAASTIQGYKDGIANYTKEIEAAQKKVNALRKKQNELTQKNLIKYAKEYLATQEKNGKLNVYNEEAYWKLVAKQAKKGSDNRKKALDLANKAHNKAQKQYLADAQETLDKQLKANKITTAGIEGYWRNVAKELDKDSKYQQSALKKAEQAHKDYQNEILQTAKDTVGYTKKTTTYSMAQLEGYWKNVAKQLDDGSKNQKEALTIARQEHLKFVKAVKQVNKEYKAQIEEQMNSFAESAKKIQDSYAEAVSSFAADLANVNGLFGEFKSETELTTDAMVANIRSQVNALDEYNKEMDKIRAMNLPEKLVEQLADLGTDGLAQLKVFTSMTEGQLAEYTRLWEQRSEIATREAKNQIDVEPYKQQMKELITETDKALAEVHATYKSSMAELGLTVNVEMPKVGQGVVTAMQLGFDNSKQPFKNDVDSLVSYVQMQLNAVTSMYRSMASLTARKSGTSYSASFDVGKNISQGMADGVAGSEKAIKFAVQDATDAAVNAAKNNLKIKSPSRVFRDEVGAMIPAGMADGVEDGMPDATRAMSKAIERGMDDVTDSVAPVSMIDSFRGILSQAKEFYEQILDWFIAAEERMAQTAQSMIQDMGQLLTGAQQLAAMGAGGYSGAFDMAAPQSNVVRVDPRSSGAQQVSGGGDTFIFNSPKAIDEITAAKEMKRAKQDLAEGF